VQYKDQFRTLSESEYYDFVFNQYTPAEYESDELHDDRFFKGTYYSHVCRTRCYLIYREILNRLPVYSKIVDFGFFPGTIIRQLYTLLNKSIRCFGVGLKADKKFEEFMKPYMERCVYMDLDPFYTKSPDKIKVPFKSATFEAVVATEILEHLISPIEMISEGARILKTGGLFLITTPNVSHIGAVLKLLIGRSNYERLDRSPMYLQKDEWRGHIRYFDKKELRTLFQKYGLKIILHRYYDEKGWEHAKWPSHKRLVVNVINRIAPIYREGHFAVFQKA